MDNNQNTNHNDSSLEDAETEITQPSTTPTIDSAVVNDNIDALQDQAQVLDNSTISADADNNIIDTSTNNQTTTNLSQPKLSLFQHLQKLIKKINIYVLIFALILLLAAIITFVTYQSHNKSTNTTISGQSLSAKDLQNLANDNNAQVGNTNQTLTIASNSIFNGQVLMKNNLDVAGTIQVGGTLSLPGITVSGTSSFNNLQVGSNLSIAGNTAIKGTLSVQNNIAVNGSATFGGNVSAPSMTINQLKITQDLQLDRHIIVSGVAPRASIGQAVGNGGTVSVNGNDTAGTVNINFGSNPPAGILANISFANTFSQTPHVVITPAGSNCAGLSYYVNRNTTGFSIGTINSGPAGSSCSFDYFAID